MNLKNKILNVPSFTWNELVKSNTASAKGIDNTPTNTFYWDNLQYLAEKCLQPAIELG